MEYDLLLFDLDNTLFDFTDTEKNALRNTFHTFNLPNGHVDYRDSYKAISKVLWDELEQGRITLDELKVARFSQLFIKHNLNLDAALFGQTYIDNIGKEVHLIDGVEEMIARFSDRRLAILTNGFTDAQNARIASSSLHNSFEAIITSEEAGTQKPQAKIFEYTLDKLQITDKSRVLMIGDSLSSDIQGGNNFGIDTCWFNPLGIQNETAIQPTFEIQNWSEFLINERQIVN